MFAIVNALAGIGSWLGGLLVAHFGYKVALAASILAVYLTVYGVSVGLLSGFVALIPANGFTAQALQFFPDSWAVTTAATASLGTAAILKTLDTWKAATGAMVRVAS